MIFFICTLIRIDTVILDLMYLNKSISMELKSSTMSFFNDLTFFEDSIQVTKIMKETTQLT